VVQRLAGKVVRSRAQRPHQDPEDGICWLGEKVLDIRRPGSEAVTAREQGGDIRVTRRSWSKAVTARRQGGEAVTARRRGCDVRVTWSPWSEAVTAREQGGDTWVIRRL